MDKEFVDNLSIEAMTALINHLKTVRARRTELRSYAQSLHNMITNMKDSGMVFVNNQTGEELNPKNWDVYDAMSKTTFHFTTEKVD